MSLAEPENPIPAATAYWPGLLVLLGGLLLTALVDRLDGDAQRRLWRAQAISVAEQLGTELRYRLLGRRASLVAATTLYYGSEEVTAKELREAAEVIHRSGGHVRLPQLAWLRREAEGVYRTMQSTAEGSLLAPGTLLNGEPALRAAVELARARAPELQVGELFVHEGSSLLALAVAAPNNGDEGVLVEILSVERVLSLVGEGLWRDGIMLGIEHPRSPGVDHARQPEPQGEVWLTHTQQIDMGAFPWTLTWRFDGRYTHAESGLRRLMLWLSGLLASGSLAWVLHTTLGRKREVEREVQRQRSQLEATYAELHAAMKVVAAQERMAALGQLVAGVAHELNTPIGNALLAASSLDERNREIIADVDTKQLRQSTLRAHLQANSEAAQLVQRNLQRAASLVQGFKQVAVDRASERRREFDLAVTIGEITATLAPQLRVTRHTLQLDIPAGLTMRSFPGPLGQVLTNLIVNSLTHAFPDGRPGTLRIAVRSLPGDRVELRYSDDGVGIPEAVRGRVFDPFFTTRLGEGGSGLGLNIALNLVHDVLGGTLRCEPSTQGVLFVMALPRVAP